MSSPTLGRIEEFRSGSGRYAARPKASLQERAGVDATLSSRLKDARKEVRALRAEVKKAEAARDEWKERTLRARELLRRAAREVDALEILAEKFDSNLLRLSVLKLREALL